MEKNAIKQQKAKIENVNIGIIAAITLLMEIVAYTTNRESIKGGLEALMVYILYLNAIILIVLAIVRFSQKKISIGWSYLGSVPLLFLTVLIIHLGTIVIHLMTEELK